MQSSGSSFCNRVLLGIQVIEFAQARANFTEIFHVGMARIDRWLAQVLSVCSRVNGKREATHRVMPLRGS
jgi:hypothetical protein